MARAGRILFLLSMSLWVGGIAVLGAIVAPALFKSMAPAAAGEMFGTILRRFAVLELTCGGLALLGASLVFASHRDEGLFSWLRIVLVTVMILVGLGATFGVNPKVRRLREIPGEEARREFDRYHRTSERLMQLNFLLGLGLLGLSAWNKNSR